LLNTPSSSKHPSVIILIITYFYQNSNLFARGSDNNASVLIVAKNNGGRIEEYSGHAIARRLFCRPHRRMSERATAENASGADIRRLIRVEAR
jgi:hypothetical protein